MATFSYTELVVWQRAMDLVVEVYRASAAFRREETYGLTAQMRRAAVSVPSNIAEGQGRDTPADFRRFLSVAYGSLCELQTHIGISRRLGYLTPDAELDLMQRAAEIGRLLNGLSRSLASKP